MRGNILHYIGGNWGSLGWDVMDLNWLNVCGVGWSRSLWGTIVLILSKGGEGIDLGTLFEWRGLFTFFYHLIMSMCERVFHTLWLGGPFYRAWGSVSWFEIGHMTFWNTISTDLRDCISNTSQVLKSRYDGLRIWEKLGKSPCICSLLHDPKNLASPKTIKLW